MLTADAKVNWYWNLKKVSLSFQQLLEHTEKYVVLNVAVVVVVVVVVIIIIIIIIIIQWVFMNVQAEQQKSLL